MHRISTVLGLLVVAASISTCCAAAAVDQLFVSSASNIDLAKNTVKLPLYAAKLASPSGATAYYLVTEASTPAAAKAWGVSLSKPLATLAGTKFLQQAKPATPGPVMPSSSLLVPAGINFAAGKRSLVPNPSTAFPPLKFTYSAQGNPGAHTRHTGVPREHSCCSHARNAATPHART